MALESIRWWTPAERGQEGQSLARED